MSAILAERRDFLAFARPQAGGGSNAALLVQGARCAACLGKIERTVAALPGVTSARMNLTNRKLSVAFASEAPDLGGVVAALEALGYPATPFDPRSAREAFDAEGRQIVLALAVAGFGAMNAMMFSVPIWAGLFGQELGPATRVVMMWLSGAIGAPCALFAGLPFFKSAWRSLRAGRANMDVPISIGVLLTLILSFSETILGGRDAYFDAAVSLLFLLLVGRWLEHRLRGRARSAAGDILALQAPTATRLEAGRQVVVPLAEVRAGDRLLVWPGQRAPVDGRVIEGRATLDNSVLTGESAPAAVSPGEICHAGALNLSGTLEIEALASCEDSSLADLARLVEAGAQSRSRYVRLADRAAAIYVPVVHTASLLTFLGAWAAGLGVREAIIRAVAVLIVTCPCALGLAAPAVQITASARLFRRKVLVKSGAALERLAEVTTVVFDKTGVLTEGRPRLLDAVPALVAEAAPLARGSRHPLAVALAREAGPGPMASEVREYAGEGVEGRIDGRLARLGRADFVGAGVGDASETELWFGFENETKFRLRFSDRIRPEAARVVGQLRERGLAVEIISGDRPGAVAEAARAARIERWSAGQRPQDKARMVEALQCGGAKVLMVGDGLNDTAALAKAHAAMAPGSALEASQNAADLVFLGESLEAVVDAVDVARDARRRALENFGLAALYNLVAIPAAVLGLVNPFVAAIAMSASSLVVTLNALRTGRRR